MRKTITLMDKQDQWIKTQIAAGGFTNDSEYIRDLVRRDQPGNKSPGYTTNWDELVCVVK